jgi:hypothetical protein
VANTLKYISYTVPAYTTSVPSNLNETNGSGLFFTVIGLASQTSKQTSTLDAWQSGNFAFSSNQTNFMSATTRTVHITGVQMEVGEQATPFEHRSFGDELTRCRRYTQVFLGDQTYSELGGTGIAFSTTNLDVPIQLIPQMRSTPALTNSGNLQASNAGSGYALTAISLITQQCSKDVASVRGITSGMTANTPHRIESANNTTARVILSAEL